jgi:hypothetical protein
MSPYVLSLYVLLRCPYRHGAVCSNAHHPGLWMQPSQSMSAPPTALPAPFLGRKVTARRRQAWRRKLLKNNAKIYFEMTVNGGVL